jgi:predicted permease
VEGYSPAQGEDMEFHYNIVGPAWFETLDIPLQQGRGIAVTDRAGSPGVIVVNEAFARRFWPGQSALGRRVSTQGSAGPSLEVVGVARDARFLSLTAEVRPYMYFPGLQERDAVVMHVRTWGDPLALREAMRRAVATAAPGWQVENIRTMHQQIGTSIAPQRIAGAVLSVFGVVALLLVAVGLYGVVAYAVASRTREIGVRVALGARPRDVVSLMVRQGLRFVFFGALIGLPAGWAATRLLSSFLIGKDTSNGLTHVGAVLLLGTIALVAAWIPARRAAVVQPMVSLRDE